MTTTQTIDGVPRALLQSLYTDTVQQWGLGGNAASQLRALLEAPAENVIDVAAIRWAEIQKAASESTWMPPEYIADYWVDDVCCFLREGPAVQPQGEPVAWQIRSRTNRPESVWTEWRECSEMERAMHSHEVGKLNPFGIMREIRPLYAEQPAPVAVARMCDCNQGRLPCTCKSSAYDGFDNGTD